MKLKFSEYGLEAGLDEVGRGCLAGPVVAAAVILPQNFAHQEITDSKKLTSKKREVLSEIIQEKALYYSIEEISPQKIDEVNILQASFLAMHQCIDDLKIIPEFLLIDGNRFKKYPNIPHECIIKGDGKYLNIAAASILAKVYRDHLMKELDAKHPEYDWKNNKGYPTQKHKEAIVKYGITEHHRKSFKLFPTQYTLAL